jgi:hypothetical protein
MPIRIIGYIRRASKARRERRGSKKSRSIVARINKDPERLTINDHRRLREAIPDLFDADDYHPSYDPNFAEAVQMCLDIQASRRLQ